MLTGPVTVLGASKDAWLWLFHTAVVGRWTSAFLQSTLYLDMAYVPRSLHDVTCLPGLQ